ncbi:MAG: FkbM family methyltransferase, partial [Bryobacteraceae bacterium]
RELFFGEIDKLVRKTNSGLKARVRKLLPSQLKRHRIMAGPLRGLSIVASWRHYHTAMIGTTEPPLISWFERNVTMGETWLDIGANYGYTALALRRQVGKKGRVFAFEPKLSTCGCLAQTMALNEFSEVTVLPVGLGEPDQLELRTLAVNGGMVDSINQGDTTETILVSRLDWLWPQICGQEERIDGVKIDVQGMELEVLKGMRSILTAHTPKLVIELHRGVSRRAVLDLLDECGYEPHGEPIYNLPDELSGPQYRDDRSYVFLSKQVSLVGATQPNVNGSAQHADHFLRRGA